MKCVDLKTVFGRRYKIAADPSAGARNVDPWYWTIPCRRGEIYPYGGDFLCASVRNGAVSKSMRSWPELTVLQDADDETVFKFHVNNFEKVAQAVGAKKRRRMSVETMKKIGADTAYVTPNGGEFQRSPQGASDLTRGAVRV